MLIRYPVGGAHFFPQEPLLSFYPGTMEGGGPQDLIDPIEQSVALDERVKQKMSDRQVTNLEALELDDLDQIF